MVELPDFDDFMELAGLIGDYMSSLGSVDNEIKSLRAEIAQRVVSDEAFFINNRPPSSSYMQDTYFILGTNTDEKERLAGLFASKVALEASLERAKREFDVLRQKIEVWRTYSANQRSSVL